MGATGSARALDSRALRPTRALGCKLVRT